MRPLTPALQAVLPDLVCPICRSGLRAGTGSVGCAAGHRFDVARQGYLSLLVGRGSGASGDDAVMVAARRTFLDAGHYAPLTRAVVAAAAAAAVGGAGRRIVIDVGAGTGHHLAAILDADPAARGLALDASTPALRRAARAHPRAAAVGTDVWAGLPVRDGAADVVLDVFSPRHAGEFARVLSPGGRLLVAVPQPSHLVQLVEAVEMIGVDADKDRRLEQQFGERFDVVAREAVTWQLELTRADAANLVAMTPSARHVDADDVTARLAGLPEPLAVDAAVRLIVLRLRRDRLSTALL